MAQSTPAADNRSRNQFWRWRPVLLLLTAVLTAPVISHELCLDFEGPRKPASNLTFCTAPQYSSSGCCTPASDAQLRARFVAMAIADQPCADAVKGLLCAECDPWATHLFAYEELAPRKVPILCNSTSTPSYCSRVFSACKATPIFNSPFLPAPPSVASSVATNSNLSSPGNSSSTLQDTFPTTDSFCQAFGPPSAPPGSLYCYSGVPYTLPSLSPAGPPAGGNSPAQQVCLDKVAQGSYLNLVPYPDGSNRAALTTQGGVITLVNLPEDGQVRAVTEDGPVFLDLTARVTNNGEMGLLGFAFHPNFSSNGRFFVSYSCDSQKFPDCKVLCACNPSTNCTPDKLGIADGCRFSSVIAEYHFTNGSAAADPAEVKRILTMGHPYTNHNGGQLLFGPADGYLYFMMGDGGSGGDPFNNAQNKASMLGKIHRLDVDSPPGTVGGGAPVNVTGTAGSFPDGLWGNYAIPATNPFVNEGGARPEIYTFGNRNPWRCQFDRARPLLFMCGDVGQDKVEEVDVMFKGGNYGWRIFEGSALYKPGASGGGEDPDTVQVVKPVLEYDHKMLTVPAASITGGFVSRSPLDACFYGRYLYNDLYGPMWSAGETFPNSFQWGPQPGPTAQVAYQCAPDTTLPCKGDKNPDLGMMWAWGEDNDAYLYVLTSTGVYRITKRERCGLATCPPPRLLPTPSPTIVAIANVTQILPNGISSPATPPAASTGVPVVPPSAVAFGGAPVQGGASVVGAGVPAGAPGNTVGTTAGGIRSVGDPSGWTALVCGLIGCVFLAALKALKE